MTLLLDMLSILFKAQTACYRLTNGCPELLLLDNMQVANNERQPCFIRFPAPTLLIALGGWRNAGREIFDLYITESHGEGQWSSSPLTFLINVQFELHNTVQIVLISLILGWFHAVIYHSEGTIYCEWAFLWYSGFLRAFACFLGQNLPIRQSQYVVKAYKR